MLIQQALDAVTQFHRHIGETVASDPGLLEGSRKTAASLAAELRSVGKKYGGLNDQLILRALLAVEELAEWLEAHHQENTVDALDAAADRLFVLLGDVVATGLPIQDAFSIVAASNLSKSAGKRTVGGKGIKAEGYEDPKAKLALLLSNTNRK